MISHADFALAFKNAFVNESPPAPLVLTTLKGYRSAYVIIK